MATGYSYNHNITTFGHGSPELHKNRLFVCFRLGGHYIYRGLHCQIPFWGATRTTKGRWGSDSENQALTKGSLRNSPVPLPTTCRLAKTPSLINQTQLIVSFYGKPPEGRGLSTTKTRDRQLDCASDDRSCLYYEHRPGVRITLPKPLGV